MGLEKLWLIRLSSLMLGIQTSQSQGGCHKQLARLHLERFTMHPVMDCDYCCHKHKMRSQKITIDLHLTRSLCFYHCLITLVKGMEVLVVPKRILNIQKNPRINITYIIQCFQPV